MKCKFEKEDFAYHCITHNDTVQPRDDGTEPLTCDVADGIEFNDD